MLMDISLAQSIVGELLHAYETRDGDAATKSLERIRDEVKYSWAMGQRLDLMSPIHRGIKEFPNNETIVKLCKALPAKLYDDERQAKLDIVEGWWTTPDIPLSNPATVTFKDSTAEHSASRYDLDVDGENWSCEVQTSLDEPFRHVFTRFRVQQNKKYRHPFLPCLDFEMTNSGIAKNLADMDCANDVTVRDVLATRGHDTVFPFLRKKHNLLARNHSCITFQQPWERKLPSWFTPAPPTWLAPTPPPAYRHLETLKTTRSSFQCYIKVPLLNFAGTHGKEILPSITTPPMVASDIYIPVSHWAHNAPITRFPFDVDADHVQPMDKLIPPLSIEQALPLLGRVIEYSIAPLAPASEDNSKAAQKKRRKLLKDMGIGDRLHNFIATPWGWDPSKSRLYCLGSSEQTVILDVSQAKSLQGGLGGLGGSAQGIECCQWLGLASLPEDLWGLEQDKNATTPPDKAEVQDEGDDYTKHLQSMVDKLDQTPEHRILEVKNDSNFLIGDTFMSKDNLDFELVLTEIAQGIWKSAPNDDNDDILCITMHWVSAGSVDYDNPIPVPQEDTGDAEWEPVGECSVDSGSLVAITEDALYSEPLVTEKHDATFALENLLDLDKSRCTAIPGGVICSVDDGGYSVSVKRDSNSRIVAIKIQTYEGD